MSLESTLSKDKTTLSAECNISAYDNGVRNALDWIANTVEDVGKYTLFELLEMWELEKHEVMK